MNQEQFEKLTIKLTKKQSDFTFNLNQVKALVVENRKPADNSLITVNVVPINDYGSYVFDIIKEKECPKSIKHLALSYKSKNCESSIQYRVISFSDLQKEVEILNDKNDYSSFLEHFKLKQRAKKEDLQKYAKIATQIIDNRLTPKQTKFNGLEKK